MFRSWGRVGTQVGDNKLEVMSNKLDAIEKFASLYKDKTGNEWVERHNFQKLPGKLYPLDIDYGEGDAETRSKMTSANSKSKLPKSVQDLVCMLFDVEMMKKAMIEFEIDLTKMPLGKLSRRQLEKVSFISPLPLSLTWKSFFLLTVWDRFQAYGLLGQAQKLLDDAKEGQSNHPKFVDVSNQFYTLIPHDFGLKKPDILDNTELIKVSYQTHQTSRSCYPCR